MVLIETLRAMIMLTMFIGNWFRYGQQPELFKSAWIHFVTYICSKLGSKVNDVAFVWSPKSGNGYPYRGGQFESDYTRNSVILTVIIIQETSMWIVRSSLHFDLFRVFKFILTSYLS